MGIQDISEDKHRVYTISFGVWKRSTNASGGRVATAVKMLEKLLGPSSDEFKERLLCLQEVQLDKMRALEHYEMMQDKALARENQKVKRKGILQGDLVLRYNSKLDKTFQKKFQIKWEGPFKVMESFVNGTYQLAHLDGCMPQG